MGFKSPKDMQMCIFTMFWKSYFFIGKMTQKDKLMFATMGIFQFYLVFIRVIEIIWEVEKKKKRVLEELVESQERIDWPIL